MVRARQRVTIFWIPLGDWAMCCGFGVKARAGREKLVRHGGREFFVKRGRLAARIPPQSPVTLPNHRALQPDLGTVCAAHRQSGLSPATNSNAVPPGVLHLAHRLAVFDFKRTAIELGSNDKQVFESGLKVRNFPIHDRTEWPRANLRICGNQFDLHALQVKAFSGTAVPGASCGSWKCPRIPTQPSFNVIHMNQNCRDGSHVDRHVKLHARRGGRAM